MDADDSARMDESTTDTSVSTLSVEEYYDVTYHATRAAFWDVIGDVTLTLVLAVVGLIGLQLLLSAMVVEGSLGGSAILPAAIGLLVLLAAGGGILSIHDVWPFD